MSIKSRLFILCVFELSFTHFTSYSNLHYTYRCEQRFSTVFGMKTKKRNRLEMSSVATIVLSQTKPRKKEAGTGKTVPTVALINDNRRIVIIVGHFLPFNWVCNRNKWTFTVKNIVVSVWLGVGVTTQRRGAILGNRCKKAGKHCATATQIGHEKISTVWTSRDDARVQRWV